MNSEAHRESWLRRLLRRSAWVGASGLLLVVLLAGCGGYDTRLDLLAHGRLAWLEAATLGALISVAFGLRRPAWIFLLALVLDAIPIASLWLGGVSVPAEAPRLRCLLFNVRYSNERMSEVAAFLREQEPDLLAVQEVTPALHAQLVEECGFIEIAKELRPDPLSAAIYRRADAPIEVESSEVLRADRTPVAVGFLSAQLRWGSRSFRVVVPRILPPVKGEPVRALRAEHYAYLRGIAQDSPALVLIGDLNSTPFSSDFRALLRETGLRDSAQGFGYQPSWPTFGLASLAPIPIDHVLHSAAFVTAKREVIRRKLGSDHFPVLAELVVAP